MKRLLQNIFILMLICAAVYAQDRPHVLSVADYTRQIKTQPEKKLVELTKVIPGIKLDIKYATADNFMHKAMYKQARAFARAPVAEALKLVQADLKLQGLGIKIFDAYRPYAVTVDFYNLVKDTNFVAYPKYGSKHNRGCAIDLTIIDLKTGRELEMPTPFDSFKPEAYSNYANLLPVQIQNRALLKSVMEAHGFAQLSSEWWHFDFAGYKAYELLDVPFEKL